MYMQLEVLIKQLSTVYNIIVYNYIQYNINDIVYHDDDEE